VGGTTREATVRLAPPAAVLAGCSDGSAPERGDGSPRCCRFFHRIGNVWNRKIKHPKKKSFFLFGPRGTGKTTWTKQVFPGAARVDLLRSDVYAELVARRSRLEAMVAGAAEGAWSSTRCRRSRPCLTKSTG
jgi:hypothetical protein